MDWTLTLIGSIVGSIIISVIANLFTEPIKSWITNWSLISKRKRIVDLENDLARITYLYQDNWKLKYEITYTAITSGTFMILGLASGIFGTASLVATNITIPFFKVLTVYWIWAATLGEIGGSIFLIIGLVTAIRHMNTMRKLMKFDQYKLETETRISELRNKTGTN